MGKASLHDTELVDPSSPEQFLTMPFYTAGGVQWASRTSRSDYSHAAKESTSYLLNNDHWLPDILCRGPTFIFAFIFAFVFALVLVLLVLWSPSSCSPSSSSPPASPPLLLSRFSFSSFPHLAVSSR
ncbi:hypothetical protein TYRP_005265 [Tyrophagus putrescentiae]|nr:hypothetical protein TYRP_005265 [Tyrophagus putrescentiae]